MEILHASFLTLKSSFDEIFTLKTALIQIVSCSAQRNMVQVQKIDTPTVAPSLHKISQAESPNEIKPSSPEKEYQPLEAQEVEDIFSLPPQEEKSMFQTPEKKAAEQSFPKEDFIKKLKEL